MASIALTSANFEQTITDNGIVIIDFWAAWCGPCRMFSPIFEKASEKHADIVFGKVDTDAEQQLAGGAGIQSIPTLMAFRDGILIYRESGALPERQFEELIEQIKGLDMEDVRRQIAEAQDSK